MEYADVTIRELFELESKYNDRLSARCNELMKSGDEEKIREGFQVQYGRFAVRDFFSQIKVFAHNKANEAEQNPPV